MSNLKRAALAIIAGMLLLTAFSGCSLLSSHVDDSSLLISEVVSSNSSCLLVDKLGSPDWIELFNGTGADMQLEGCTLTRADTRNSSYTFPSAVIKAGEYMIVAAAEGVGGEEYEYLSTGYKLPKEGSSLVLKNADGKMLCSLEVPSLDRDISWAYSNGDYSYCATPTPGAKNGGMLYADLKELYSAPAPEGLIINEASNTFLELKNTSVQPIQLALFCLSEDAGDLTKWRLPYRELAPGEYFVINFDGQGEVNAGFGVSQYEAYLYLCHNGEEYATADISGLWDNMSVGLNADGETVYFADTTPGVDNSSVYSTTIELTDMGESSPVRISELMLKNKNSLIDEYGDRSDWAEIHNYSDAAVSLKNYFLSDDPEDVLKWNFPDTELEAGGYMIVYLSGRDEEKHTGFKVGESEPLILTDFSTLSSQSVLFPDESRLPNISYGEKDGQWLYFGKSTPGKENTTHGGESISNVEKLDKSEIYISEISSAFAARSGGKDWIELYNPSDSDVSLDGLFLSNDSEQLTLFPLSGSMGGGEYKVVYASKRTSKQGADTAPFSISQAGETVYISDENGGLIDVFDTGALRNGCTSGRAADDLSGERVFFTSPTKGAINSAPVGGELNAPEFSQAGGFVSGTVTLEITGEGIIYYTTDGSRATESSNVYTSPLTLTENTVVSAICASEGRLPSDPATATYIFGDAHTLPVVCLSMAQSDFSSMYSVSTWSSNKNNVVERECNIEYYEADGSLGTSFPAGVRVAGNSTRTYPQKSLGLYLRSGYGQTSVVYPFFEDYAITEFNGLVLRNAGQNCQYSRMSDAYTNMLFCGLDTDAAQTRFVVVYINGRYWGVYDLKENQNEDCFAAQHGIDADTVNVIRRNTFAIAGSNTQMKQVLGYAQSWNLADDAKYEEFSQYVDTASWIDYIIARSYSGDGDMFNQKMWNTSDYSVKWRPIFYDCDFAFGGSGSDTLSQFFTGDGFTTRDGSKTNMYIPTALKKNSGWCDAFVERYAEVMKYLPDYSLKLYDKMFEELKPEMKRNYERWGLPRGGYSSWEDYVKSQRTVLEKRPDVVVKQIRNVFGVSDQRMKELFPDFY